MYSLVVMTDLQKNISLIKSALFRFYWRQPAKLMQTTNCMTYKTFYTSFKQYIFTSISSVQHGEFFFFLNACTTHVIASSPSRYIISRKTVFANIDAKGDAEKRLDDETTSASVGERLSAFCLQEYVNSVTNATT